MRKSAGMYGFQNIDPASLMAVHRVSGYQAGQHRHRPFGLSTHATKRNDKQEKITL